MIGVRDTDVDHMCSKTDGQTKLIVNGDMTSLRFVVNQRFASILDGKHIREEKTTIERM